MHGVFLEGTGNSQHVLTSSKKRLDELPAHEEHLKQLHDRLQEDELGIHLIKSLDDKVVKSVIAQAAINRFRLED